MTKNPIMRVLVIALIGANTVAVAMRVFSVASHAVMADTMVVLRDFVGADVSFFDVGPYCATSTQNLSCARAASYFPELHRGIHTVLSTDSVRRNVALIRAMPEFQAADVAIGFFPVCASVQLLLELTNDMPCIMMQTIQFDSFAWDNCGHFSACVNAMRAFSALSASRTTLAASTRVFSEWLRYFTGIDTEIVVPHTAAHLAGHVGLYTGAGDRVVVCPKKRMSNVNQWIVDALLSRNVTAELLSPDNQYYSHDFLPARARAVVFVSYSWAPTTLSEVYAQNIPIFVPSPTLVWQWIEQQTDESQKRAVLYECFQPQFESLDTKPFTTGAAFQSPRQSPHHWSRDMFMEWFPLHVQYELPFVRVFDSYDDLAAQVRALGARELAGISAQMSSFNSAQRVHSARAWSRMLNSSVCKFHRHENAAAKNLSCA